MGAINAPLLIPVDTETQRELCASHAKGIETQAQTDMTRKGIETQAQTDIHDALTGDSCCLKVYDASRVRADAQRKGVKT